VALCLKKYLLSVLSQLLENEMKAVYGPLWYVLVNGFISCLLQFYSESKIRLLTAVMGKPQIECHCHISYHLVNRFKALLQILNLVFTQISNLLVTNVRN